MRLTTAFAAVPLAAVLLGAVLWAAGQPWIDKPAAQWTDAEARQVINDSPWAKKVDTQYEGKDAGRGALGGLSFPGGGAGGGGGRYPQGGGGYPGGGGGRYPGGGGYPPGGGGYPPGGGAGRTNGGNYPTGGGNYPTGGGGESAPPEDAPAVTVRWESARPVREAELKTGVTDAPDVGEADYAIAIYGLPKWVVSGNPEDVAKELKKEGYLRRDGQKDVKASRVRILDRDSGPVVIYLFSRSKEITQNDVEVLFTGKVGRIRVTQFFKLTDMVYQGKLEL